MRWVQIIWEDKGWFCMFWDGMHHYEVLWERRVVQRLNSWVCNFDSSVLPLYEVWEVPTDKNELLTAFFSLPFRPKIQMISKFYKGQVISKNFI